MTTRRRARRWWLPVLWAFSVIVGVVLGAVIAKSPLHDGTSSASMGEAVPIDTPSLGLSAYHRVATLAIFDAGVWPDASFGPDPDGFQFQWFHGMAVLAPGIPGTGGQQHCLTIVAGARRNAAYSATACSSALTPGIVPLTVTERAPAALRAAFPIGTRLLFALSGGEVGVYARGSAITDSSSPNSVPLYPPAPDPLAKLHGYRKIATLASRGAADPHGSFAGGREFDGFKGLSVVALPDQTAPDRPSCLVVSTATPDHRSTPYATTTCGPAMAPAIAQLTVTSAAPRALRAALPAGTGLLFVFDGDVVIVYADRTPNS